jgi:hypothetical protein
LSTATDKHIDVRETSLYRMEAGMATAVRKTFDAMEFLGQLGVTPPPERSEERISTLPPSSRLFTRVRGRGVS